MPQKALESGTIWKIVLLFFKRFGKSFYCFLNDLENRSAVLNDLENRSTAAMNIRCQQSADC